MNKTCFIVFAHPYLQDYEDINDLIHNISHFCKNSDFIINHPYIEHTKVKHSINAGPLNSSSFIFGILTDIIKKTNEDYINNFDHFCLVSANQYFINEISFEKNVNYVQFLNTEDWDNTYNGKDFDKTIVGFPLQQPYGRWDPKNLYKRYDIETPMSANWECLTFTKEVMILSKKHIDMCLDYYPNQDMMNIFIPYMVLMSNQKWEFPKHFGTYDPSNRLLKNHLLTTEQITEKFNKGYFSVKRVNYNKNCDLKKFIKERYYNF